MLDLAASRFLPKALALNPASVIRIVTSGGEAKQMQVRALAPRRSWRPLRLSADGPDAASFQETLNLLNGGTVSDLSLTVATALWRAGLLLTAPERAALPVGAQGGAPEIETIGGPFQHWLPPEDAGTRLWRRIFPAFDRLDTGPFVDPSAMENAGFAPGTPVALPGLLSVEDAIAAAGIWRALYSAGLLLRQEGRGCRVNNDPLGRILLRRMTPLVEQVTGLALRPSYTYAMLYDNGAVLPMHVDRLQCEYTLSLMLDFSLPPIRGTCPWPVEVELIPGAPPAGYHQGQGDGILFCGRKLVHGRPRLADGHHAIVLMLHWVSADFPDADMDCS